MTEEIAEPGLNWHKLLLIFGVVAALGLIIASYFLLVQSSPRTHNVEFEVVDWKWTRSIEVEEFKLVTETGWKDELPADAKILSQKREFRRNEDFDTGIKIKRKRKKTEQKIVKESYDCYKSSTTKGSSGYWSRCDREVMKDVTRDVEVEEPLYEKRPVYDTLYTYQTMKWTDRGVPGSIKSGQGFTHKPEWGTVEETPTRRIKGRSESYIVKLHRKDRPGSVYYAEIPPDQIEQIYLGTKLYLDVDHNGRPLQEPNLNVIKRF